MTNKAAAAAAAPLNYTFWHYDLPQKKANPDYVLVFRQIARLVQEMHKHPLFKDRTFFLPSRHDNSDPAPQSPGISVLFPTEHATKGKYTRASMQQALAATIKANFPQWASKQPEAQPAMDQTRDFTADEQKRMRNLAASSAKPVTDQVTAAHVPVGQVVTSIRIERWRLQRLQAARGDDLAGEIQSVVNDIKDFEDNGGGVWATLLLVVSGIATVVSYAATFVPAAATHLKGLGAIVYGVVVGKFPALVGLSTAMVAAPLVLVGAALLGRPIPVPCSLSLTWAAHVSSWLALTPPPPTDRRGRAGSQGRRQLLARHQRHAQQDRVRGQPLRQRRDRRAHALDPAAPGLPVGRGGPVRV